MSTDGRTWTATGTTVTGTAPGRPDIAFAPVPLAGQKPALKRELKAAAELLADALNRDGEPHLDAYEKPVLDCVLQHQASSDWPCPMGKVVAETGFPRQTVSNVFDRLVSKGFGTRPPRNQADMPRQSRPFVAHTKAQTTTGEKP